MPRRLIRFKVRPGSSIRAEAVRLARECAEQRRKDGDPEGSAVIRDLARAIGQIEYRVRG